MGAEAEMTQDNQAQTMNLQVDGNHAEICIHTPNEKINKLSRSAFEELYDHCAFLKNNAETIKTLLIYSDKPGMFLAGADINEIKAMTTEDDALQLVQKAQEVFQELSELPQISMVAIDGPCLGGGLELALACKYRIASDSKSTKIGLPEVQIGVLPGAGGTQRLPRVVGLIESLKMITSGAPVVARKALKTGLISDVVPHELLLEHCRKILKNKKYLKYKPKDRGLSKVIQESLMKGVIFKKTREAILKKTRGNYPAPLKALEVIEKTFKGDLKEGLKVEAKGFAELAISETAKNFMGIFFATEELKKDSGVGPMEAPDFKPAKIKSLAVVGAGIMGGGIAAVASQKGVSVRLKDINTQAIGSGLKTAHALFNKGLKRRKINKAEFQSSLYRVSPALTYGGFKHIPFVIEAVVEKMEVKQAVFKDLEDNLPENAIIATNTSSLSLSEMASQTRNPERVVGMHFFNPVPQMPLVEVVRAEKTSPEVVAQTVAFGRQLGKTVIVVKDSPGFLINRILMPFLNESAHLKNDGYSIEQIDKAAVSFGMPMGPFRLLDEIGFDVAAKVSDVIAGAFPHMKVLPDLHELIEKGYLGARKSGKGFYQVDSKGKFVGVNPEFKTASKHIGGDANQRIIDRLILPMVAEATLTLDEGVVSNVRDLDLGLVFGIGFPPFHGGLMKWVSQVGERQVLDRMNAIHQETKGRLIVPKSFEEKAQAGQSFYPS
jgi:3-hydroxyacyl-CoA dehydrogenase/enoyl-CoA hydratase/3-hydroxybutyryl-CoA epimerase